MSGPLIRLMSRVDYRSTVEGYDGEISLADRIFIDSKFSKLCSDTRYFHLYNYNVLVKANLTSFEI